jgi:hypothetical protein
MDYCNETPNTIVIIISHSIMYIFVLSLSFWHRNDVGLVHTLSAWVSRCTYHSYPQCLILYDWCVHAALAVHNDPSMASTKSLLYFRLSK